MYICYFNPLSSVTRMCTPGQFKKQLNFMSNMEHKHNGHHFTHFYVTTTVESRRNFRVIMEAFAIYFLSMEIVILVHRQTFNQNNFAHEYAFELIIVAFGLATAMQLTLLLKDFPTGVIYECMSEWHRLQLFLHFGGFLFTAFGIVAMVVSETSVEEHEFTATIGALVASIINATWYTISKIYEKAVKSSVPAITVTDTDKGETIVLEGPFRRKAWLQRPMHRRQDKHLLVVPDIPGSRPVHVGNNQFSRIPSEVYMEQAVNRERYAEEMTRKLCEKWKNFNKKSPGNGENDIDVSASCESCITIVE